MKKSITLAIIGLALVSFTVSAVDLGVTGRTVAGVYTITNAAPTATMGKVLIAYANANYTNTIYFDVIVADGTTYRIGSDSVVTQQYSDASDLIAWPLKAGEKWKITTTVTNVNLNIDGI